MPQYKNLKITPDVFERLREDKPNGESWSRYLEQLHRRANQQSTYEES